MTIYGFGRMDKALSSMYKWYNDFSTFPKELKQEGCCKNDLKRWITTIETGLHKSGRSFVHQKSVFEYLK